MKNYQVYKIVYNEKIIGGLLLDNCEENKRYRRRIQCLGYLFVL